MSTITLEMRKNLLKQFDEYIFANITDEEAINDWLVNGISDCDYTDDDLALMAEDEEFWMNCVECFTRCCKLAENRK